jgi:hypothetical protein
MHTEGGYSRLYASISKDCANRFLENLGNQTTKVIVIATEKNPRISEIGPHQSSATRCKRRSLNSSY